MPVYKLHKMLNACIRYIYNVSVYNHTTLLPFYKQCHILPLKYCIQFKLCLVIFKILNNLSPTYLNKLFKIYVLFCDNLRSASDCNKIITDHCFNKTIFYKICDAWNPLPLKLVQCPHLLYLRKSLKVTC